VKPEDYLDMLLAGDEAGCLAAAREIAVDVDGLRQLCDGLIAQSQYRLGELWEAGRISVAAEHLATAINTSVAAGCLAALAPATSGGPKALVTCAPDEQHDLGARLLADLLQCDGWDVAFFGASMPLRDLVKAVGETEPRFVGISAATVMRLGSVQKTIAAVRAEYGPGLPIIVGGNAFRSTSGLWQQVSADMYAPNASRAVDLLRELAA
jgi:MerR family transcriptional regulator, light-induced transcriptional regulator